jgi:hypothetical protein
MDEGYGIVHQLQSECDGGMSESIHVKWVQTCDTRFPSSKYRVVPRCRDGVH